MEDHVKTDKPLEILCDKFTELKEPEKDYILGIAQALAQLFFVVNRKKYKGIMPSSTAGVNIAS